MEGATQEFAHFGSAVSEALAAANQAASLGEQALQHSTAALNSGQASAVAQAADWSHEAQAQQSSVAMEQQPGPEQLPEAGFGYLLTAPNLPPGMSHQDVCA